MLGGKQSRFIGKQGWGRQVRGEQGRPPAAPPRPAAPPPHPRWRRLGRGAGLALVTLAVAGYVLASLLTLFAREHWLADLLTNFRVHLAAAGVLLSGLALLAGRLPFVAALAATALHGGWLLWPLPAPLPPATPGPSLRLVTFNVLGSNPEPRRTVDYLRALRPDVVALQETDASWWQLLDGLHDILPFSTVGLPRGRRDMAIYSRFPVRALEIVGLPPGAAAPWNVAVRAVLDLGDRQLALYNVHPPHPMSGREWKVRNGYHAAWAARAAAEGIAMGVLVAGDFNATPYDPFYDDWLERSGLRDAAGSRLQGPTRHPVEPVSWPWLGIPIDHVLVSPGIGVRGYAVGPPLGSDHQPVTVDLDLGPAPTATAGN